MASRKSIYFYFPKYFMAVSDCIKYFRFLLIIDKSMLTCSYIGELRNGRKFKCDNKLFSVFVLIFKRVLF